LESANKAELKAKTLELAYRDAIERAISLCSVFAVLFALYGVTSIGFIRKFAPQVTLWNNLWPRVLFCSIPFMILGRFLKGSQRSNRTKLFGLRFGQSL
jgi:hypothetical protein